MCSKWYVQQPILTWSCLFAAEYFIPQGWQVLPILTAAHLDTSLHQNPSEFDPSRWAVCNFHSYQSPNLKIQYLWFLSLFFAIWRASIVSIFFPSLGRIEPLSRKCPLLVVDCGCVRGLILLDWRPQFSFTILSSIIGEYPFFPFGCHR